MKDYVGNTLQVRGAERYVLQDGKGDGMHFVYVRNGLGLEAWISVDRCADVSRLIFKGNNFGFFSPCGYVAPSYYDKETTNFLKSFTAGFFTTCGLTAVGSPCVDRGEVLPLHGTVSNIPAVFKSCEETNDSLKLKFEIYDKCIFSQKLTLVREYEFSYRDNTFTVHDTVINEGDAESPYMLLYHCNMGYPLVDEECTVKIPNNSVKARNERSAWSMDSALIPEKPQAGYEECCYYYDMTENEGYCHAGIFQPKLDCGVVLSFDKNELPCFTEWKMMGKHDYVIGLEPGNCTPDGRDVLRKNGTLRFVKPDETKTTSLKFVFADGKDAWNKFF